jgi:pilus assembly protein Flp/PilA
MSKIVTFLKDESGASAAEYALLLAVVAAVIATAAGNLATAVGGAIDNATTVVNGVN